jgi:hypothetical protein
MPVKEDFTTMVALVKGRKPFLRKLLTPGTGGIVAVVEGNGRYKATK